MTPYAGIPLLCENLELLRPHPKVWAFVMYGGGMSVAMLDDADLADIDEALRHLSLVPEAERGQAWHAYSDALLERRKHLEM